MPRFALRVEEAAASLGVSRDLFEREIIGELRVVKVGRVKLIAPSELERWMQRHAAIPLVDGRE